MIRRPATPGCGWSLTAVLLGAALLTGCEPNGRCTGSVGGTAISEDIDGDSALTIVPAGGATNARGAQLILSYGGGALRVLTRLSLPLNQDTTAIPLVMTPEEARDRLPQDGFVSLWKVVSPAQAPEPIDGTFTVKLADPNNLEGEFEALYEDGSRLHCTYDVRGQNDYGGDAPPL